ncbi:MAG: hypothetical protein ACE5J2_02720 [Nitrososphaerales archaeon]
MPEIWLKYGSTEVVLDIKAENLLDYVSDEPEHLKDEQINAKLDAVTVKRDTHIAVLDKSLYVAKLALMLVDTMTKRSTERIAIDVPEDVINVYRNAFQDKDVQISKLCNGKFASNNAIFLSRTSFDPLFGYSGAPTSVLKYFPNEMLDAYKARDGDMPKPGVANNALSIAHKFADGFDATSVEAILGTRGFADIIINKPSKAHADAISKLESFSSVEVEKGKASIASSGNGQSTLSHAMTSLWNCMDAIKEEGSITLLAECRDGFGSGALEALVEGKMNMDDAYSPAEYRDGLENLLYLAEVGEKYDLALISTLPEYYTNVRLGFKTFRRIKDALHYMLNVHGPKQKVLVISDARKVLLKPKN